MDDLISRKAAIEAMEQAKEQYFDRGVIIGKMQDIVNNLPSAEPTEASCWGCNCPKMERMLPSADPDPSDVARDIATIIENEKDMRVIAQPVRKGKWIEEKEDWRNQIMWVSCSECGFASGTSYNFCPNCGAMMSEGEEEC